jgi:hypothetical protein
MWSSLPKAQRRIVICDIALQPMWRYSSCHHRSSDVRWSLATNFQKYSFWFPYSPLRYIWPKRYSTSCYSYGGGSGCIVTWAEAQCTKHFCDFCSALYIKKDSIFFRPQMLQPNFWSLKHESTVEKGNFEHLFKIEANLKICRFFFTSLKAKPKIILGVAKPFSMFLPSLVGSGGQNDDFRPLTFTLGGRGMGCRDKYVTFLDAS